MVTEAHPRLGAVAGHIRIGCAAVPWKGPASLSGLWCAIGGPPQPPGGGNCARPGHHSGVAVLALLIYRQLSARPVSASALRLIAILAIIGVLQTIQFLNKNHAHPLTYAAIGGSLVLAAIFGALRASTVRIWLQDNQAWSQGNWLTAALWIASLAAHLGYDLLVVHGPGAKGLGTATIVLYLAVSLGFQRVLVLQRAPKHGRPHRGGPAWPPRLRRRSRGRLRRAAARGLRRARTAADPR